jgi:hypothetical protein
VSPAAVTTWPSTGTSGRVDNPLYDGVHMTIRRFPQLRDEGSCAVAAHFTFSDPKAPGNLVRFSSEWSVATAANPLQPFEVELFSPPRVDRSSTANLDVVFDVRPGSRY